MKKRTYIAIVTVLVLVILGSAAYLANYFLESKRQSDQMHELSAMVNQAKETEVPTTEAPTEAPTEAETEAPTEEVTEATEPAEPTVLACYQEVYEKNPDMVGWIKIEGTPIDYPVMQTSRDNANYYLYRDFYKKDSNHGSVYVREECDVFAPSDNVTMYGHNMKDGSMFASLDLYYEKENWENNSLIFFDTVYESHVYKVFAAFQTTALLDEGFAYHRMEDAASEEEFNEFVATCKRLALYNTGITPAYGDKLICLSTCDHSQEEGRFVVAAVRIV